MKLKAAVVCGAVVALAVPSIASAAPSENKVTGGGQYLVPEDGGPGSTLAFTAQGTAETARGQIQQQLRADDGSKTTRHGTVTCVDVQGTTAKLAGLWRDGTPWQLYVQDNGEGAAADNDLLGFVEEDNDDTCDFDPPEEPAELGRGNIQVHKSKGSKSRKRAAAQQKASWTQALQLAKIGL